MASSGIPADHRSPNKKTIKYPSGLKGMVAVLYVSWLNALSIFLANGFSGTAADSGLWNMGGFRKTRGCPCRVRMTSPASKVLRDSEEVDRRMVRPGDCCELGDQSAGPGKLRRIRPVLAKSLVNPPQRTPIAAIFASPAASTSGGPLPPQRRSLRSQACSGQFRRCPVRAWILCILR
jgi:hypothetical protein